MSNMDKPIAPFPNAPFSTGQIMPLNLPDPSIRKESFDELLRNRGIHFIHRRAVPCPNLRSLDDNTHDPNCTFCGNKGFMYYESKEIVGAFSSNSLQKIFEHQGIWEIGTASVTMTSEYVDGTQADFAMYDQLYIPDYEERLWELREFIEDKDILLRYPITKLDSITSVERGVLTTWILGTHFTIDGNGNMHWISDIKPSYNSNTERGSVLAISYFAHPSFIVVQHMRELRATQEKQGVGKVAVRLPQQLLIKKEFLVRQQEKV